MKLIIESRISTAEEKYDFPNKPHEIRHEREVGWDARACEYVEALGAFMFDHGFGLATIIDAFRDYVEMYEVDEEAEKKDCSCENG